MSRFGYLAQLIRAIRDRRAGKTQGKEGLAVDRVESVQAGAYTVAGGTRVTSTGRGPIPAGAVVVTAWAKGKPRAILNHSARRAQFGPRIPRQGGPIVEILFVAENGFGPTNRDVWFRNYDQVTKLDTVRSQLATAGYSAPAWVKWGDNRASFIVRTDELIPNPLALLPGQPATIQVPVFHVFQTTREVATVEGRESADQILPPGGSLGTITLQASYRPHLSTVQLVSGGTGVEREVTYSTTLNIFTSPSPTPTSATVVETISSTITVARSATPPVLTLGAVTSCSDSSASTWLTYNEAAIEYRADRNPAWGGTRLDARLRSDGHLLVSVRWYAITSVASSGTRSGNRSRWTEPFPPCDLFLESVSTSDPGVFSFGAIDAHAAIVDMTDGVVLWQTNESTVDLEVTSAVQSFNRASLVDFKLGWIGRRGTNNCETPFPIDASEIDLFPSVPVFDLSCSMHGHQGTDRVKQQMWRQLALLPELIDKAPGSAVGGTGTFYGSLGDPDDPGTGLPPESILRITASGFSTQIVASTYSYSVRRAVLLPDADPARAPRVFLTVQRTKVQGGLDPRLVDLGAFIMQGDTLLHTAYPFTAVTAYHIDTPPAFATEPDEIAADTLTDGTDIEVLSITGQYVLWRKTTRVQREDAAAGVADPGGTVHLTSLQTNRTVQVGTNAFAPVRDELYLGRPEFMYAAEDNDRKEFVEFQADDVPTLVANLPLKDGRLEDSNALADLPTALNTELRANRAHWYDRVFSTLKPRPSLQTVNDVDMVPGDIYRPETAGD